MVSLRSLPLTSLSHACSAPSLAPRATSSVRHLVASLVWPPSVSLALFMMRRASAIILTGGRSTEVAKNLVAWSPSWLSTLVARTRFRIRYNAPVAFAAAFPRADLPILTARNGALQSNAACSMAAASASLLRFCTATLALFDGGSQGFHATIAGLIGLGFGGGWGEGC